MSVSRLKIIPDIQKTKRLSMKYHVLSLFILLLWVGCRHAEKELPSYSNTPVTTPQRFAPGIISTEAQNEFDLCFSPDGNEVYFTRRKPGEKQQIYRSHLVEGTWSQPVLASFSTDRDETPFITPDGNTLYFGSERPIPGKPNKGGFDMNVWKVERMDGVWGAPTPLPEPINFVQDPGENWPSSNANLLFTRDGSTHYFATMNRGAAAIDIYTSTLKEGTFSQPQRIEGLFENDSLWKYSATVSPDGQYLIFNTYEGPEGEGGEDLYVSKKTGSGWSPAKNLGALVNTPGEEGSGRFSPDGNYFFYVHADNLGNDQYSTWSIYFLETEYLELESLFEGVADAPLGGGELPPPGYEDASPTFTADGKTLVFARYQTWTGDRAFRMGADWCM